MKTAWKHPKFILTSPLFSCRSGTFLDLVSRKCLVEVEGCLGLPGVFPDYFWTAIFLRNVRRTGVRPWGPRLDLEVPDVPAPDIRDQPIYALCVHAPWALPTYDAPLLLGQAFACFVPRHHSNLIAGSSWQLLLERNTYGTPVTVRWMIPPVFFKGCFSDSLPRLAKEVIPVRGGESTWKCYCPQAFWCLLPLQILPSQHTTLKSTV